MDEQVAPRRRPVAALRAGLARVPLDAWTLERFGLTPGKLPYRVVDRRAPRVLSVSLPKAGTHLLERAVCLHPRLYRKMLATVWPEALPRWGGLAGLLRTLSPGQVAVAHLPFEPGHPRALRETSSRALFLTRDPRDVVLSQAHFAVHRPDHPYHASFRGRDDLAARVLVAIEGDAATGLRSIAERLDAYAGWLDGAALVVRFEDLIGPEGGGDRDRQRSTVEAIYRHLGVDASSAVVDRVIGRLFSDRSPTFRKGAAGGWREALDDDVLARFHEVVGDRMARYGYA
jgi:hypothetical protein